MAFSDLPARTRRRITLAVAATIVVLLFAAFAGCRDSGSPVATELPTTTSAPPEPTTTSEPAMDAGTQLFVYAPAEGDCFDRRNTDTGTTAAPVPGRDATPRGESEVVLRLDCASPHQYEVIGVAELTDPPEAYPGDDEMVAAAKRLCPPFFRSYVGQPYETSELELGWVHPTEEQWRPGQQRVGCLAYAPDGKLTGSVRGSAR